MAKHMEMSAQDKQDLLAYLEAILGCVKSLHAGLGAVMADLAAVRATVFDDADEITAYRTNLKLAVTTARPMVDEALRSYDDLMEEITNPHRWQN
jgi:hypothetical protein